MCTACLLVLYAEAFLNVLSGLLKRIDRSVKAISVNDLPSLEKVKELLASA